jgi:hypothetical protein
MLPSGKQDRKDRPVFSGVFKYFPDALAEVAHVSFVGNVQHNPGQPMAWSRHKSTDHGDCIARHLLEAGTTDSDGLRHSAKVAWRALALLQIELENEAKPTPFEEVVGMKMEGAFGPLMYANTHTDAREPAAYEAERKAAAVADHVGGSEQVPFMTAASFVPPPPTFYIAGPMRNYPDFNFPAFDAAKAHLEAMGCNVISPADMDRADPQPRAADTLPQYVYAKRDAEALITLAEDNSNFNLENGIYMLQGWQRSKGARAEHALAEWLGLKIVYQENE